MPDSRDAAVSLVREMYDAAVEHGPRALVARYRDWFAEDFEWTPILVSSLDGRAYRGEAEFAGYWDEFLSTFSEIEVGQGSLEPIDDETILVTARLRMSGAGSGVPIDRTVAYLFEVRGGLIVTGRTFFSPADAREFLARA